MFAERETARHIPQTHAENQRDLLSRIMDDLFPAKFRFLRSANVVGIPAGFEQCVSVVTRRAALCQPDADWRASMTPDAAYLALRAWTLRKYGLTLESYEAMHVAQGGVCAICGKPETGTREGRIKRLSVDHSRQTGRVRELLCCRCNQAIGLMREDPTVLRAAAAYIDRHAAGAAKIATRRNPDHVEAAV
jgi:recombination endonuclease VII